jgi:hypothetical protein
MPVKRKAKMTPEMRKARAIIRKMIDVFESCGDPDSSDPRAWCGASTDDICCTWSRVPTTGHSDPPNEHDKKCPCTAGYRFLKGA